MGSLSTSASAASQQVNNMKNAWDFLGNNMGNVISSLDNAHTYSELPIGVQAYLNTANKQWTTVQDSVKIIQAQMVGVKTTVLKDSKGNLSPLNSQVIEQLKSKAA